MFLSLCFFFEKKCEWLESISDTQICIDCYFSHNPVIFNRPTEYRGWGRRKLRVRGQNLQPHWWFPVEKPLCRGSPSGSCCRASPPAHASLSMGTPCFRTLLASPVCLYSSAPVWFYSLPLPAVFRHVTLHRNVLRNLFFQFQIHL